MSGNDLINDIRNAPDFQGYSFSNYKRTEVRNTLIKSILNEKSVLFEDKD